MKPPPELIGKRVLVVEDEMLVAMLVEDTLQELGCEVVGPVPSVSKALNATRTEVFDVALLDVNLAGQKVYPVAEALEERGIPFVLLSGYGQYAIPAGRTHWRVCSKPFTLNALSAALIDSLAAHVTKNPF